MIKSKIIFATVLLLCSEFASASPGVFLGVTYAFGSEGGPGVSLKVLSDNKDHKAVVGAGASFYPLSLSNKFGLDADLGYVATDFAATVGWDFLQHGVQVGAGYVHTTHDKALPAPAPAAPAVLPNGCGPGTNNSQC